MIKKKNSRQVAIECARVCDDKKAADIVLLDVRKLTYITDFFVVGTVTSERQARAIAFDIEAAMKSSGKRLLNSIPRNQAGWILADFGDVVVHVFSSETRKFYDIESLWADAPAIKWRKSSKK